jgi:hypothetical protein
MAGGDEFLGGGGGKRAVSALLFLASSTNALDAYSALNSSPWTAESFGGDPEKEAAMREYVWHAIAVTMIYAVASAAIAQNPYPIYGAVIADIYMYWLYDRAAKRAKTRGSKDWDS